MNLWLQTQREGQTEPLGHIKSSGGSGNGGERGTSEHKLKLKAVTGTKT